MSSFLDKLNQQAAAGSLSTPKVEADTGVPEKRAESPKTEIPNNAPPKTEPPARVSAPASSAPASSTPTSSAPASSAPAPQPARAEVRESYEPRGGGLRNTEHDVEIDRNYGTKRFLRLVATLLVIALLIAAGVVAFRYFTMVTLPEFTGKTIAEMRKWCIDNKLYLTENPIYSMEVGANYVIGQSEPGGTELSPKSTIEATYSLGADPDERVSIPDLMNMKPSSIRTWMEDNKLPKANIFEENSDDVAKGDVIKYLFSSVTVDEQNFKRGDSLIIYVSKGPFVSYNTRTVKNFVGLLRSEVDSWCANNGMKAVYTVVMHESIGADRVISQSVPENTQLDTGSTIEFVISEGPGLVVPSFVNVYKEDAMSYAEGFNVIVKLVYNMTVPYGGLVSQSRPAGTVVDKSSSEITLIYSIGKPYLTDFVGMRESSLPEYFYEMNRKGALISYSILYVNAIEPKGTIIGATHSLEAVELNAHIELKVSNGLGTAPVEPSDPIKFYEVPDYSKVLSENAQMLNLDINLTVITHYSDSVPYGSLISQSARAGSLVTSSNNSVTAVYSAGKPYIDNLLGRSEADLPAIFYEYTRMGASVTYEITYVDSAEQKGNIVSSSKNNEYIKTNEVILIEVSKGS